MSKGPRGRRHDISEADKDLRSSLTKRLTRETYECMVCFEPVRKQQAIWSCDNCWAVFHSRCISKWAASSTALDGQPIQSQHQHPKRGWRCPGCQRLRLAAPPENSCFCGKHGPDILLRAAAKWDRFGVPHGCQEVCGRPLGNGLPFSASGISVAGFHCPHTCTLLCHPGPCPSCEAQAPAPFNRCFCKRLPLPLKCSDLTTTSATSADGPLTIMQRSCGQLCGALLKCGQHRCDKVCHPGECESCCSMLTVECHCGQSTKQVRCSEKAGFQPFGCGKVCGAYLDCGKHRCERPCHGAAPGDHCCPLTSGRLTQCPCGKAEMAELYRKHSVGPTRTDCTQPVLTCSQPCDKLVRRASNCPHLAPCSLVCHAGPCVVKGDSTRCKEMVTVRCRCGRTTQTIECNQQQQQIIQLQPSILDKNVEGTLYLCDRVCRERLKCGRHRCMRRCCDFGDSADHDCPSRCDRPLRCGKHHCELDCHKGLCPPCSFIEWGPYRCHCGATAKEPPIKCGDPLPRCSFPCVRTRPCGHHLLLQQFITPQQQHECHSDDEPCPPCAILVAKRCRCGKQMFESVPCHQAAPACHLRCLKPLSCGHSCQRFCHWGGCVDEDEQPCKQPCLQLRLCGHSCRATCHGAGVACPAARVAIDGDLPPCQEQVQVQCRCGNITHRIKCGEIPAGHSNLACNAECEIQQRLRNHSLMREPPEHRTAGDERLPFSRLLLTRARANLFWVQNIERQLDRFIKSLQQSVLRFPSMRPAHLELFLLLIKENYPGLLADCTAEGKDDATLCDNQIITVSKREGVGAQSSLPQQLVSQECAKSISSTQSS